MKETRLLRICVIRLAPREHQSERGVYAMERWMRRSLRRLLLCLLIAACWLSMCLLTQVDPPFSDYRRLQSCYNPAAIGLREDLLLTTTYHQQWIGIEGAPANLSISAHTEQQWGKSYHDMDVVIATQCAELLTRTEAQAEYVFQLRWKGNKILSIGTSLGMINLLYDGTKTHMPDGGAMMPSDPLLPQTPVSGHTFDLSAGALWHTPRYFIGFSGRHLTVPRVTLDRLYYQKVSIHINAVCGYNITPRGALLSWYPSLFASTNLMSWRVGVNLDVRLVQRWEAGLIYRPLQAAGLRLGALFDECHVGYLFEMSTSQLARGSWGSHEPVITYALPMSSHKKGTSNCKSIRLL